jgi:hypothetical protein
MAGSTLLRRYTDLPSLIHLLGSRELTLVDPSVWDDKNDSRYLETYRDKANLRTVLALCFTQASEMYHHWRVFAHGPAGVCVRIAKAAIVAAARDAKGVSVRSVKYLTLAQMRRSPAKTRDLPFVKRIGFQDEKELRVVFGSADRTLDSLPLPIPLGAIDRITLSPWIHKSLVPQLKERLRSIKGCSGLDIVRSTLISNQEWQNHGQAAV